MEKVVSSNFLCLQIGKVIFLSLITRIIKSSLLKESILYGFTGVISKFAPLLVIPIYISTIGVEGFGVLDLYVTIGMAVFIICEAQAVSGVMRSYYECKKANTLKDLISSAIKIYLVTYAILLILFFLLFLIPFKIIEIRFDYLLPIVLAIFPRQLFSLNTVILRMEHQAKQYVTLSLLSVLLTAMLGIIFIHLYESSALSVLYGIALSQFVLGIISSFYIQKLVSLSKPSNYLKEIISYGVPIAISSLAGWLLASSGRLVIADKSSDFDLGVYSLSLKVAMVFMVLLQAFRTAWDPYCMKKFGENNSHLMFAKSLNVYWAFGSLVIFLIYILSPFLILLLGADERALNQSLILLILLGYLWQGAINIIAVGNAWARKTYVNSFGTIAGGGVSLCFSYLLVNELGVIAGGLGYLFGIIVSFYIIYYLAQKNQHIPYNNSISILFFLISMGISFFVIY